MDDSSPLVVLARLAVRAVLTVAVLVIIVLLASIPCRWLTQ